MRVRGGGGGERGYDGMCYERASIQSMTVTQEELWGAVSEGERGGWVGGEGGGGEGEGMPSPPSFFAALTHVCSSLLLVNVVHGVSAGDMSAYLRALEHLGQPLTLPASIRTPESLLMGTAAASASSAPPAATEPPSAPSSSSSSASQATITPTVSMRASYSPSPSLSPSSAVPALPAVPFPPSGDSSAVPPARARSGKTTYVRGYHYQQHCSAGHCCCLCGFLLCL